MREYAIYKINECNSKDYNQTATDIVDDLLLGGIIIVTIPGMKDDIFYKIIHYFLNTSITDLIIMGTVATKAREMI